MGSFCRFLNKADRTRAIECGVLVEEILPVRFTLFISCISSDLI